MYRIILSSSTNRKMEDAIEQALCAIRGVAIVDNNKDIRSIDSFLFDRYSSNRRIKRLPQLPEKQTYTPKITNKTKRW